MAKGIDKTVDKFIVRTNVVIRPDASRVLFRPFENGSEQRLTRLLARVLSLTEDEVDRQLIGVLAEFHARHQRLRDYLLSRFHAVKQHLPTDQPLSEHRQLLIGSYFTQEYSLEAAALFNPSIVLHPDQENLAEGSIRFILSLRATGEGHISCITFRSGVIDKNAGIVMTTPTPYVSAPNEVNHPPYVKELFLRKLQELGATNSNTDVILDSLDDQFTVHQLRQEIQLLRRQAKYRMADFERAADRLITLALSNYQLKYSPEQRLSERVIFPTAPNESKGIEDARFVRFISPEGKVSYIATYTAYDGTIAIPQILETDDFLDFKISTLNGPEVQNKGMALFPRRINGLYTMLSRQDGENLYLMYSDDLHFWHSRQTLLKPTYPWEFSAIGNCGSPIETEFGWLVLTHGIGPMRKYSIGAILLDLEDPTRVIARTMQPLITPDEKERIGYVPNVVYTCGSLLHAGHLIIPYAMSDSATTFATIPLERLLESMQEAHS